MKQGDGRKTRRRALDGLPSLKAKLSILIIAAVAVTAMTSLIGLRLGWPIWLRPVVSAGVALTMVQLLARGLTRPLREVAAAAEAMAKGRYGVRVTAGDGRADEIGVVAAAFNSMASELETVEQHRRDLLANVSHELRTPLSGLQATLENLLDNVVEPTPALVGSMAQQVQRLSRLVTDLLELARFEAGAIPLRREPVDVGQVVADAVSDLALRHAGTNVTWDVQADGPIDVDPDRMHQVLANLLDNAVQHGGQAVSVAAYAVAGRPVRFEVSDDGPGIAQEVVDRIFQRFYRADDTSVGTGLGLAISQFIVELHGGSIRAEPRQPHGTTIIVDLAAEDRTP